MNLHTQYPEFEPFVGSNYGKGGKPRILLIAESHYFPKSSNKHLDPIAWYSGTSDSLTPEERGWITTKTNFVDFVNGYRNRTNRIWRNLFSAINSYGPKYAPEHYKQVVDDIAFFNFFARPAREQLSLKLSPYHELDGEIANQLFLQNIEKLKPHLVIFISQFAYSKLKHGSYDIPIQVTPHPGCSWWNRSVPKYGYRKGKEMVADYLNSNGLSF